MDTGESRPSGKFGNYLITLVIEAVCGLFRFAVIGFFAVAAAYAVFAMATDPTAIFFGNANPDDWVQPALIIAFLISYSNIFVSLAAYIGLGGGSTVTRFVLGAREPSRREEAKLYEVFGEIVARADFPVDSFSRLFILDAPFTYSYVVGTTLYISSGAINDRHLQALLAHELGHLHYGDGETILALRRLVFPIFQFFVGSVRDFSSARPPYRPEAKDFDAKEIFFSLLTKVLFFVLAFLGGGIGVWVMSWSWASYFRKCDYAADAFAVRLGYKDQLIEYLEETKFYDTSIPYMLGWRPSNELRIDRLIDMEEPEIVRGTSDEEPEPAPVLEPISEDAIVSDAGPPASRLRGKLAREEVTARSAIAEEELPAGDEDEKPASTLRGTLLRRDE
jgi:Zn-dependent protease with chaperone function